MRWLAVLLLAALLILTAAVRRRKATRPAPARVLRRRGDPGPTRADWHGGGSARGGRQADLHEPDHDHGSGQVRRADAGGGQAGCAGLDCNRHAD